MRAWSGSGRTLRPRVELIAALLAVTATASAAQTPIPGKYPPGQSGIRGAANPRTGWTYTNFNRFFTNLEVHDEGSVQPVNELRFANISMFTWASDHRVLGMKYGALCGIPFATGNLQASSSDIGSKSFGLGDVLVTPISLNGAASTLDYQFQFTVWTPSGHFEPGGASNRGNGAWALVYSIGGVAYPGGARDDWSLSAVARFEQNFEQKETGVKPGDDVVVDWGLGKVLPASSRPFEVGVSGFGTWQLSEQEGGAHTGPYRYFGAGPEASKPLNDWLALRLRLQWEFGTRNAIQGNNAWLIANFRL